MRNQFYRGPFHDRSLWDRYSYDVCLFVGYVLLARRIKLLKIVGPSGSGAPGAGGTRESMRIENRGIRKGKAKRLEIGCRAYWRGF